MGKLQLRLPDQIHKKVRKIAERESLSINQILVNSISNEIIRYESLRIIEDRSSGYQLDDFLKKTGLNLKATALPS